MPRLIRFAELTILACLLGACAAAPSPTSTITPVPPTPSSVPPTPTSTPTQPPPTATSPPTASPFVELTIVNDTGEPVCGIFVSTRDHEGEVPNLTGGWPLVSGGELTTELDPGIYDINVMGCEMNTLQNLYDVELVESMTWNLSEELASVGPETLYVEVVNQRSYDLCEFYIRPAGSEDWGENLLNPEVNFVITPGSSYIEWLDGPGAYDLMLKDCAGNVARQLINQEIPSSMTWTLTP